ncbi:MAG: hypothetical protein QXE61_03695 [Nitrososphaerota archaeon]
MNMKVIQLAPRLKVIIKSDWPIDKCRVCGSPLKINEDVVSYLLGDRLQRFKATALYFQTLGERAEKVLKREINLDELGKMTRRLWSLNSLADFVVSYGNQAATIYCENCQSKIPILLDVNIDTRVKASFSLDDVLKLDSTPELDIYFKRESGKTWKELCEEAKVDPWTKTKILELLKNAEIL